MFGLKISDEKAESVCRWIHAAVLTVTGGHGRQLVNKVTERIGLGRIELCDNPNCENCAPAAI
jgi:hypothetical protein